jgi:TP901 family phage tail tape measure protein
VALSIGEIFATLALRDRLSPALKIASHNLKQAGTDLQRMGTQVQAAGSAMLPFSAAVAAAGVASFKFGKDFEATMDRVGNITDIGAENIDEMSQAVLAMAPTVGIGPTPLAEALLVVASTGLKGATALQVLESSARASAVGLGETKDIARAVTAAMTAYGVENLSAAEASDKLFAAVRAGGAEATEFAGTLGRVVGIASQVGVSFDEVLASVATFTRLGVSAEEAVTALRGVMATLLKPSKDATEQLAAMGLSIDEVRKSVRERGLMATLTELVALTRGNDDALAAIVPNIRALAGIMGTAGAQADAYAENLAAVKNASGDVDRAFAETSKTVDFQWRQAMTNAQTAAVTLFNTFKVEAGGFVGAIAGMGKAAVGFADGMREWPALARTATLAIAGLLALAGPGLIALGATLRVTGFALQGLGVSAAAAATSMALFAKGALLVGTALAAWQLGKRIGEVRLFGLELESWVPVLWNWKLGLGGMTLAELKQAEASYRRGRAMAEGNEITAEGAAIAKAAAETERLLAEALAAVEGAAAGAGEGMKRVTVLTEEQIEAAKELAKSLANVERHGYDTSIAMRIMAAEMANVGTQVDVARHPILDTVDAVRELDKSAESSILTFRAIGQGLENVGEQAEVAASKIETLGDQFQSAFDDVATILDNIPGKLAEIGAVAARTGKAILKNLADGDIWGAIVAGVTGVITVLGKLFGPSEKEKVDKMRQAWIDAAGGWGAINEMAQRAGMTLDRVLNARTVEEYEKALKELEDQFEAVNDAAEEYGLTWADLADPARRMTGLQDELEDLYDTFLLLTGAGFDADAVLDAMGDDFMATLQQAADAGILDEFLAQMVELGIITEDVAAQLLALGNAVDYEALMDLADEYGITLAQLGPTFAQGLLADQFMDLLADFEALIAGGADYNGVLEGMSDEISALVQQALLMGTSIPESMRPIIESLIEQGLLLDANGDLITDISDIEFTEDPFEAIADGLSDLLDLLREFLGIADHPPDWDGWTPPPPPDYDDYGGGGDTDQYGNYIPMAHGGIGRVTEPTMFLAGEAGPEDVAFSGGGRRFGEGGSGDLDALVAELRQSRLSSKGTVNFNITTFAASPDPMRQLVYKDLGPLFLEWLAGNTQGSQTELRRILE